MIKISRSEFEDMRVLGFIDETKNNKNFTITNRKKSGKCKTYYVCEATYKNYKK